MLSIVKNFSTELELCQPLKLQIARKITISFLFPVRDMATHMVSKVAYVFALDPYQASCPYNNAKSHNPDNTKWRQKARTVPFRDWDLIQHLSTYSAKLFNVITGWQRLLRQRHL
jgi:hypothetical protein